MAAVTSCENVLFILHLCLHAFSRSFSGSKFSRLGLHGCGFALRGGSSHIFFVKIAFKPFCSLNLDVEFSF